MNTKLDIINTAPEDRFYNLVTLAIERGTGVEQLEKLMALNTQWEAQQAKKSFLEAKTLFQTALPIIKKQKTASFPTRTGGTMTYNYASLDDIAETIKPYLGEYGFSYKWDQTFNETGQIRVRCVLTHLGGHSEGCEMVGGADTSGTKNALQATASGITYMRRYTLTGVLGIATSDDDIDARLPDDGAPTGSETLNQLLTPDDIRDLAESISFAVFNASTVEALVVAGKPIAGLAEGKEKDGLKKMYMNALSQLKKPKGDSQ